MAFQQPSDELEKLLKKVFSKLFEDRELRLFIGAYSQLTHREIENAAGNHAFDDYPEKFGITKEEGHRIRSFFQSVDLSVKTEVMSYVDGLMAEHRRSFRSTEYTLPNGVRVYLTKRPDWVNDFGEEAFIRQVRPSIRFCFTDDYVIPPKNDPPNQWFPWLPSEPIPLANVHAFLQMMKRQVESLKGPIWLHCDFSSMRAPTYFGLYLFALYGEAQANEIEKPYWEHDYRSQMFGDPVGYAQTSMERDPGIKGLIEAWQAGGEAAALEYIGRIGLTPFKAD